jgi:hypothetical protein
MICGQPACRNEVRGIYCVSHKGRMADQTPRPTVFAGETTRFAYRGTIKEGVIERVMRSRVVVLIQVRDGQKEKLVTVPIEALLPKED